MAIKGTVNTNAYDSRYLELAWERTSYSIAENTSTIKWTLTSRGSGKYSQYKGAPFKVVIDGEQVYYSETRITTKPDMQIATGTKTISHNADGTKSITIKVDAAVYYKAYNLSGSGNFAIDAIPRYAALSTATDFTDEENPAITYTNAAGSAVTSITAYIQDSNGANILSRTLDKSKTSYTFQLTDAERVALRQKVTKGYTTTVKFMLTTVIGGATGNSAALSKTLTLVNAQPQASITILDNNPDTVALTGNANRLINGFSTAYYTITAEGKKGATIASYAVTNDGDTVKAAQGGFLNVSNPTFTYSATDSRGNSAGDTITKDFIDYFGVSCSQKVAIELVGETEAQATLTITGSYFNSTFGNVANELRIEVRRKVGDGEYSNWVQITEAYTPNFADGAYSLDYTIDGLDYSQPHTFQCRATDKLTSATCAEYTARLIPVFDWSNTDFNFNVPVSINGAVIDDFIVSQGEANGWYYRKYNSGIAECWCSFYLDVAVTTAWGGLYTSGAISGTAKAYPFNFKTAPVLTATLSTVSAGGILMPPGGAGASNIATYNHTGAYEIVRGTSINKATYMFNYHAIGHWK